MIIEGDDLIDKMKHFDYDLSRKDNHEIQTFLNQN